MRGHPHTTDRGNVNVKDGQGEQGLQSQRGSTKILTLPEDTTVEAFVGRTRKIQFGDRNDRVSILLLCNLHDSRNYISEGTPQLSTPSHRHTSSASDHKGARELSCVVSDVCRSDWD
jgi:hypothetical protein